MSVARERFKSSCSSRRKSTSVVEWEEYVEESTGITTLIPSKSVILEDVMLPFSTQEPEIKNFTQKPETSGNLTQEPETGGNLTQEEVDTFCEFFQVPSNSVILEDRILSFLPQEPETSGNLTQEPETSGNSSYLRINTPVSTPFPVINITRSHAYFKFDSEDKEPPFRITFVQPENSTVNYPILKAPLKNSRAERKC
uniref:Uncharacterized protein n=1 Tax=Acrobeloides nanus TaxID=290746 RepID=A0A914CIG0_9BILA